jgi:HAD superfamily hydrolase (TIGR01549 family)
MKQFKVLIFDVDNTLIYRLPRVTEILLDFVQAQGLGTHADALQRGERRNFAYYADGQADKERALYGEDFFQRNYVAALLQVMCVTDEVAPWLEEAVDHLTRTPRETICPASVRTVVGRLHATGYHLAAVSNRDGDLRPLLGAYGLGRYFAFTLSGGRAGVYKPDPEIYRIALRSLGVSSAAALVVGDSYSADVVGAQEAGITAVLLDPIGVFPEAPCRVIQDLEELIAWLVPA